MLIALALAASTASTAAAQVANTPPLITSAVISNAEIKALFDADQRDREDPAKIDWASLRGADETRRLRVATLLNAGKLVTGDDFYHAAFIFQHGDGAQDILQAHALAIAALGKGRTDASWIAAATLDRYLQRIGQKQVFGTQFQREPGKSWTQEPYDRALLADSVRAATGVPPLAHQEQQRLEWAKRWP